MNPNAAARLPFLKPLNTPPTTTTAGSSAANAKGGGTGDNASEFSRLMVRNQAAAAASQRPMAPAGKSASPHRPESPRPTARSDAMARPAADDSVRETDSDSDAETDVSASASRAPAPERPTATRAQPAAQAEPGPVEPVAADALEPNTTAPATAPTAPTAAELAALAAWGALPLPPAMEPTPMSADEGQLSGGGAAALATGTPVSNDMDNVSLARDGQPTFPMPNDKATLAIDAGLATMAAADPVPDATLAQLAMLSAGVRPDSEREQRSGTDLATPPAWAVGAAGAPAARSIDAAASPPVSASVATPLTDDGFHEALGMQVSLLAREGIHKAELRLNPADMGPVSVQITMNGDQARVDFGADMAQTRQALEAGWAELAASLQEAGFTLSGGGVSEHARNRQEPTAAPDRGADRSASMEDVPVVAVVAARPRAGAALDLYA